MIKKEALKEQWEMFSAFCRFNDMTCNEEGERCMAKVETEKEGICTYESCPLTVKTRKRRVIRDEVYKMR